MLFVFLAAVPIPVPAAYAADGPVARLDSRPTGITQAVYGNEFQVAVKISGVTDSVYRQVYEHEATVHYNPDELELVGLLTINTSYFLAPEQTDLSAGVVKVSHKLKSPSKPYAFSGGEEKSFSVFVFKPRLNTANQPVVNVTGITISNGQGDKLTLNDAQYTMNVVPAGNKAALKALVSQAQNVHDAAVEGSAVGQYPPGSKNTLKTAITKANNFVKDGSIEYSQEELNAAQTALQTALDAFQASVVTANKTQLNALIAEAQSKHDAAVEGSAVGQYPPGAKSTLQAAIDQAKAVMADSAATQQQIDQAMISLQTALSTFEASVISSNPGSGSLQDGEYNIDFMIYKKGTNEPSVMYDYVDRNSGKLKVQGGKKYVSFTLKQSAETLSFKTEKNGVLVETTTLSSDPEANTRVVQFEVDDLSVRLSGWVKVYWVLPPPIGVYDHEYEVDLGFSNIVPVDVPNPTNPLADGNYTFEVTVVASDDDSKTPLSSYMDNAGKIKVENGRKLITFTLKNGVTITKIQLLKADGTTQDILPIYAIKQSGIVRVLSSEASSREVQFEVEDLSATYIVNLEVPQGDNGKETRKFQIVFGQVKPVASNPETPPGGGGTTPGGGGSGGGGGGGGGGGSAPTVPSNIHGIKDGTYSVNYRILKYNTEETSVMQDYVIRPGTLKVTNGIMYVSFTLKQSKEITGFRVENDGSLVDTEVVSRDEEKNTRVVQFKVADLTAKLNGWVKIDWPEYNYFHEYNVHLAFDKSSLIAINGTSAAQGGGQPLAESLQTGEYAIDFVVNVRGKDQKSITDDYVKHPAKLTVKDGKSYIALTLTPSKEVPGFKVEKDNVLADAEVIATNEQENSRTVQFEVIDITKKVNAQIQMAVPNQYNGDYDVEILFDADSIRSYVEERKDPKDNVDQQSNPETERESLKDIENHWAKAVIERAVALGIVDGYEDGTFRPNNQVNRAEFTVMITRALKPETKATELTFSDLDSIPEWAKPSLAKLAGSNVIRGYEDGTFRADRTISRAELAVMIVRALELPLDSNAKPAFADADQIPQWAQAEVASALAHGIISGRDNNLFAPNESATRAEAVTVILAMLNHTK
jgi:heme-binding NEAT domain protein